MCTSDRNSLAEYCKEMNMSYSYKAVLIMSLLDNNGRISMWEAVIYFIRFYGKRLQEGQLAEKKNSIFSDLKCTIDEMRRNIISNPVKALTSSCMLFSYDAETQVLEIKEELWGRMTGSDILQSYDVCLTRLNQYYSRLVQSP